MQILSAMLYVANRGFRFLRFACHFHAEIFLLILYSKLIYPAVAKAGGPAVFVIAPCAHIVFSPSSMDALTFSIHSSPIKGVVSPPLACIKKPPLPFSKSSLT